MIVSFNFYYGQAGLAEAVLKQRLRACDVRDALGVPRGRVLSRVSGSEDLPDVVWELSFDDISGHHADMAVRAASADFEAIRAGMRKLCRRFERPLFEVCAESPAGAVMKPCDRVALDWIFCGAEGDAAVEEAARSRLTSSDAQRAGRSQLLRLITEGNDLPRWIVKREYVGSTEWDAASESAAPWDKGLRVSGMRVERSAWSVA